MLAEVEREAQVMKMVTRYVGLLQDTIDKVRVGDHRENVTLSHGSKYIKVIVERTHQRSVHSFINRKTGDLHKPAGWAAPSQTVNFNLLEDWPALVNNIDPYGAYLYKNNPFKR
jgi:hypothetical protein